MLKLPYAYNANLAIKARSRALWDGIRQDIRVVHYTLVKPFISKKWGTVPIADMRDRVKEVARSYKGLFRDEMHYWGKMWDETMSTYADRIAQC